MNTSNGNNITDGYYEGNTVLNPECYRLSARRKPS